MSETKSEEQLIESMVTTQVGNKRKRSEAVDEIEIDIHLPEPPSKKAKRKEKKGPARKPKVIQTEPAAADVELGAGVTAPAPTAKNAAQQSGSGDVVGSKRSDYAIWIGNLPFKATKDSLRTFLMDHGGIIEDEIVRLHLPAPSKGGGGRQAEQHNRGFAYIDFTTKDVAGRAIALSEKLLHGRRVLIKDAKNFEGRPLKEEQQAQNGEGAGGKAEKKEPTKRVFVGNLGFDVTREDIIELFSPAGDVEDVFLATFEDSGKCKGFGWVRFGTVEAAQAAVKGYLYRDMDQDGFHDGDDSDAEIITEKKPKPEREKLWVNRLQGRQLRCEFAEDAQTRYRKRFSKDGVQESRDRRTDGETGKPHGSNGDGIGNANSAPSHHMESAQEVVVQSMHSKVRSKPGKEERREERRKRHDARSIAPGKALANTHRASGAIVAGSGTKVQFD